MVVKFSRVGEYIKVYNISPSNDKKVSKEGVTQFYISKDF